MPDLLNTGVSWLAGKLNASASQSVTYTRGSRAIGSGLKATYGSTAFEEDSTAGVIRWEAKDFIFTAAHLTLASVVIEPERGDIITDHNGNAFRVLGQDGEPCFKYMDGSRLMVRVHTKQVAE